MKVGDLVRCIVGSCASIDDGVGIVVQVESYDPDNLSVCVQWTNESLWYEEQDLEIISALS